MTFTLDIYELAALLIAISFLVLVIAAIPAISQLRKTIRSLEELSTESRKTVEVVNFVIKRAGDQVDDVEELVKSVKAVGLKMTGLAELIVDNIKSPLIGLISLLFGVEYGLKHWVSRKKENQGGSDDE